MVDDCLLLEFNKRVVPIAAAALDVVSLPVQSKSASIMKYVATELVSIFFSIPIKKKNQKQFSFMWNDNNHIHRIF